MCFELYLAAVNCTCISFIMNIIAYVNTEVCGTRPTNFASPLILGGVDATASWPWMGTVWTNSSGDIDPICSITLLDSQYGITGYQCL